MKRRHAFLLLLLGLACGAASCATPPCNKDELGNVTVAADRYLACLRHFVDATPARADLQDGLITAIESIAVSAVTAPDPAYVSVAEEALASLDREHLVRPSDKAAMYELYLANGLLDRARAFAAGSQVRSLEALDFPRFQASEGPAMSAAYWTYDTASGRLLQRFVDLHAGAHVIVISTPGCHFCQDAARWVDRSPQVQEAFRHYAIWIDRPDENFGVAYYARWNREHAFTPMNTVLDIRNWPMPKLWATPQFFFLSEGKVVASVDGWTDSSPARIMAGFERLGIPVPGGAGNPLPAAPIPVQSDANDADTANRLALLMVPIRTQAGLEAYLANHKTEDTPLRAFSPPARRRFLSELRFAPAGGLAGFSTADIEAELSLSQAYEVLSLFGQQKYLPMLKDLRIESATDREIAHLLMPGTTAAH